MQMKLQRQHLLLSYFKNLSDGPAEVGHRGAHVLLSLLIFAFFFGLGSFN